MAVDEDLVARVEALIGDRDGISSRRMFGGIAWMLDGNMACGVIADRLLVRLGVDGTRQALDEPSTRPMDFTGSVMRTFVLVEPGATRAAKGLATWVERGVAFAASLPPRQSVD